ncbi:MAG TPA: hypothetical protein VGG40_11415 [Solirubrobacterales bacterium]|jgi:hypothetical protein
MPSIEAPTRLLPLAEELLENGYARDNLREGATKLREAYERGRKRRVKPSRDRKLRAQLEAALAALDEGSAALASGRRKPKRTGRKAGLAVLALVGAGAATALALNEDLRNSVVGSAKALADEIVSGPEDQGGQA